MATIKLTTPDGSKMEFDLTIDRVTIGRADDNDIVVPDGSVSSRHGEILLKGTSIELVDLGSTNGTHVNGQRVERATIAPGGTFKLGSVDGLLVGVAVAAAPAAPPAPSAVPAPSSAPAAPPRPGAPPPPPSGAPAAPPRPGAPPPPSSAPAAPPRPGPPSAPPRPGAPPAPPSASAAPSAPPVAAAPEEPSEPEEESAPRPARGAVKSSAPVITGLGATPCPVKQRKGFGPKVTKKDKVASLFVAIGVISLLVCVGAVFLISKMGS